MVHEVGENLSQSAMPADIEAMVRRLPRDSGVRAAAEAQRHGPAPVADVSPLVAAVARIESDDWRERVVAAWTLGWTPLRKVSRAEAVAVLSAFLRDSRDYRQGRDGVVWSKADRLGRFVARSVACAGLGGLGMRCLREGVPGDLVPELFLLVVLAWLLRLFIGSILFLPMAVRVMMGTAQAQAVAAWSLGRIADPAGAVALVEAALRSGSVGAAARDALKAVLPSLTREAVERQAISPPMPSLCRLLTTNDHALTIAVLGALERIGDASTADAVLRLSNQTLSAEVRLEAERVLPVLLARKQQETAAKTLVRASEEPARPGELLRPASADVMAPEQLLRATRAESDS